MTLKTVIKSVVTIAAPICNFLFAQTNWVSLSEEVNDFVYSLNVYNGKLIAGGLFTVAGSTPASKVAAWDGTGWNSLGKGLRGGFNPFVTKTILFNGDLICAGNFDSAGTIACKDIASWNGSTWSGFGSGSNSVIHSLAVYNNELYAGGTFDSINGIPASHIAKWNGISWQPLGSGIHGTNVNDLYVFQNELYVLGVLDTAGNIPCNYIAKWNGSNWNSVGNGLSYGNSALIEWNGKLLAASQLTLILEGSPLTNHPYQDVNEWNGLTWSLFNRQDLFPIRSLVTFNNDLYASGGSPSSGISNVLLWDSLAGKWQMVGTGINNFTKGLCVYNGELYCSGEFRKSSGADHNYIAKLSLATGMQKISEQNFEVSVYPNPVIDKMTIEVTGLSDKSLQIEIVSVRGVKVFEKVIPNLSEQNTIDLSDFEEGLYFLRLTFEKGSTTNKIIINKP